MQRCLRWGALAGGLALVLGGLGTLPEARAPVARAVDGRTLHLPFLARSPGAVSSHEFVGMVGGPSWLVTPVSDTLVWVGDGPHIVAIDATDPGNMREVGRSPPLPGLPLGLAYDAARDVAVVALSPDTLLTLDVRDPRWPRVLGRLDVASPADVRDVALGGGGSWALVAAGPAGVLTVDLSDPAAPRRLAKLELDHPIGAVRVDGALAVALPEGSGRYPLQWQRPRPSYAATVIDLVRPHQPRVLSRLEYEDASGDTQTFGDLVLERGRAHVVPLDDQNSCVASYDLQRVVPPTRTPTCIPYLVRLVVDRDREILFVTDSLNVIRPLDLSDPELPVLDPVGTRASDVPFLHGPAIVHRDRMFMAGDTRQGTTGSFSFADRPRLDWRPWHAALLAFDIRDRGDLVAAGRRAQSMEAVHQLVTLEDRVLALVDVAPRQLTSRRAVFSLDPGRPGSRTILWPLTRSLRLHANGDRLYDLVRLEHGLQIREWSMADPVQPVRRATVDLPSVEVEESAAHERWRFAGGRDELWVLGVAEGKRGATPHTTLWSIAKTPDGLRAAAPLTLALTVEDVAAWGDALALTAPGTLRVLSAEAAREGRVHEVARVDRAPGAVARLGVVGDRLILSERDVQAYALEDGRLAEVARHAFERASPAHGWHTTAMAVQEDRVHLAGELGLRSLRFDARGFKLLAATADLPAVAPWRAREWPGPFEEVRYATIAAQDDLIVADRRQLARYDEPFQPAGFTIWRGP